MAIATAGQRDKLVTIQQATTTTSTSGFPKVAWTTLDTEWMSKGDVSGSERLAASQMSAFVDSEWEMPYRSTMDPDAVDVPKTRRLLYLGRTYEIASARLRESHEGKNIRLITLAQTVNA